MRVRKAVIPAAGLGTRLLPASKSMPKEMITLVDRPGIARSHREAPEIDGVVLVPDRRREGIGTALLDSVPMVAITGNVPGALLGKDAFQEIDINGITLPMTKHNYLVRDADDLLRLAVSPTVGGAASHGLAAFWAGGCGAAAVGSGSVDRLHPPRGLPLTREAS